ncbi:MAG: hypothetical protein NT060_04060, partial [Candidatus Omnitrophica bacterium]|nr:hypothetical protein [Candidatus Omnitrophota bacterium]
ISPARMSNCFIGDELSVAMVQAQGKDIKAEGNDFSVAVEQLKGRIMLNLILHVGKVSGSQGKKVETLPNTTIPYGGKKEVEPHEVDAMLAYGTIAIERDKAYRLINSDTVIQSGIMDALARRGLALEVFGIEDFASMNELQASELLLMKERDTAAQRASALSAGFITGEPMLDALVMLIGLGMANEGHKIEIITSPVQFTRLNDATGFIREISRSIQGSGFDFREDLLTFFYQTIFNSLPDRQRIEECLQKALRERFVGHQGIKVHISELHAATFSLSTDERSNPVLGIRYPR